MLEEANKPRSAVNWGACFTAAAVATSLVGATVAPVPTMTTGRSGDGTIIPRRLRRGAGLSSLPGVRPAGRQPEPRRHPAAALAAITDRPQGGGRCPRKGPRNSSVPSQSDTYPPLLGRQAVVIPCCLRRL